MIATILVVDDEQDLRELLARHFRYLGYVVELAANGEEALIVLAQKKIDILISDIAMPVMDGVELLRRLRTEYPMIRPIMMTGYVTLDNALACMRYGADACIFKPLVDLQEMESAVDDALARIQYWHLVLKQLRGMSEGQA